MKSLAMLSEAICSPPTMGENVTMIVHCEPGWPSSLSIGLLVPVGSFIPQLSVSLHSTAAPVGLVTAIVIAVRLSGLSG